MTNQNISFNDGSQKITINGDPERVIRWNPNDLNFVDRFARFTDFVKGEFTIKCQELSKKYGDGANVSLELYESGNFETLGSEFNAELDKAFGIDVSTAAFQGMNPVSPVENGQLLFNNFLNALTPIIEESFKKFESSRDKYTGAFKGKRGAK